MFQYATARKIAYINNAILKLDISCINNYENRDYNLGCFNIIENFATLEEVNYLVKSKRKSGKTLKRIHRLFEKVKPYSKKQYIKEKYFHFDPCILKTSDNTYIEGYWQSEKYFKEIENIIRKEFTIKCGEDSLNKKMSKVILEKSSISIHVRRGDYVENPVTKEFHGVCSLNYYYSAIKKITDVVKNPHFFIFSDDPQWAKKNLKISYPVTYVTHNLGKKDFEDLRLMSLCKHHIVANSSFSWWGAWLCKNPNKIIYAPIKWFRNAKNNTKDLIPETWDRI